MSSSLTHGVFSSRTGQGAGVESEQGDVRKSYWFVQELGGGGYEVQALNSNDMPSGPKLHIDEDRFLSNYQPEPEYYAYKVLPSMRRQDERIARGEGHRHKEEVYSAEYEFSVAVEVDEENVRANFGLGLTYLDRGELERAVDVFKRLIKMQAIYAPEHKHLFNEFGISLRKNGMYDHALDYYRKAEVLCRDDENLFLNISRAYFEKGDIDGCITYLNKSLDLRTDFDEACMFRDFLKINGFMNHFGEPAVSSETLQTYRAGEVAKVSKDDFPQSFKDSSADKDRKTSRSSDLKLDF
ncbi:tetratricopeptide repeat protein [Maridesulfovibrio sp.]|uniref:tetratricopeptide repeat protein n=1 Tax=Maridesulfovibrio sp. TaxID=2795000 RepID=UPI002A189FA4|nr:tetratricopeptide repeat protein [Maridesulfovibrio sp.]